MPKKPAPKKSAIKPAVKKAPAKIVPVAKKPLVPAKKAVATKVVPTKAAPVKATNAKAPLAKGAKSQPKIDPKKVVPAKPVASGKPVKGALKKADKIEHEKQKKLLDNHRTSHSQSGEIVVPVRPKLQFYTIQSVLDFLKTRKKEGVKLNLWVPDEERKAREKAAIASRDKNPKKQNVAAASIADLLGGSNPFRKGATGHDESKQVPEKLRRYYHLLVAMREAIQKGLAFHAEEALKKNGKDDAGDLSGYSQHLADAGSDTADRDFALSLISNEQEALKEIADAITRMKSGGYGVCEITGKAIPHARLMAVPFTRYSLEGQKELERNRRANRRRGGNPLGEIGDEVGFGTGGGGGEDDSPES